MLKILLKGKVETVTADLVKPAHIKREPETDNIQQRQTNPEPKSMAQKPPAIARKRRTARAWSSSTTTPKSFRTGVNTNKSTNTRSSTLGVGTCLAIPLWSEVTRARLLKLPTLYKAPHSTLTLLQQIKTLHKHMSDVPSLLLPNSCSWFTWL